GRRPDRFRGHHRWRHLRVGADDLRRGYRRLPAWHRYPPGEERAYLRGRAQACVPGPSWAYRRVRLRRWGRGLPRALGGLPAAARAATRVRPGKTGRSSAPERSRASQVRRGLIDEFAYGDGEEASRERWEG